MSYDANGATGGAVPAAQVKTTGIDLYISANLGLLAKDGHVFNGWNTAADGSGTTYPAGAIYGLDDSLTLYVQWLKLPASMPSSWQVDEDEACTITLFVDGSGALSVSYAQPLHGSISAVGDALRYQPESDFNGSDQFTYTVSDAFGNASLPSTVHISVIPVNDPPRRQLERWEDQWLAVGKPCSFHFPADMFFDIDQDALIYSATGLPEGLSFDQATREFHGVPTLEQKTLVTVVADDGHGGSDSISFNVTVAADPSEALILDRGPGCGVGGIGFVLLAAITGLIGTLSRKRR